MNLLVHTLCKDQNIIRRLAKKCRVELLAPELDWSKSYYLSRLRGLSTETKLASSLITLSIPLLRPPQTEKPTASSSQLKSEWISLRIDYSMLAKFNYTNSYSFCNQQAKGVFAWAQEQFRFKFFEANHHARWLRKAI